MRCSNCNQKVEECDGDCEGIFSKNDAILCKKNSKKHFCGIGCTDFNETDLEEIQDIISASVK